MNVRPAGREPCACSSPINQILERLDQMDADIQAAQQAANTAVGTATSQAGVAAASAASAAQDASDALGHAAAAQQSADDALLEATNAAGSAQDAADDLADALLAIQNIEATIASVLASDIGAKVDKLTTAGFHLYSHTGSTQGEVEPDINPTAATIPIRDSAGKLFGADPANGATDKTLTTANWISQTGAGAPNNLLHRSGNEIAGGFKEFTNGISAYLGDWHSAYTEQGNLGDIKLIAKLLNRAAGKYINLEMAERSNTAAIYGIMMIRNSSVPGLGWAIRAGFGGNNPLTADSILIVSDGIDYYLASRKKVPYGNINIRVMHALNYGVPDVNPTPQIEWLSTYTNIGDGTGYTLIEAL